MKHQYGLIVFFVLDCIFVDIENYGCIYTSVSFNKIIKLKLVVFSHAIVIKALTRMDNYRGLNINLIYSQLAFPHILMWFHEKSMYVR